MDSRPWTFPPLGVEGPESMVRGVCVASIGAAVKFCLMYCVLSTEQMMIKIHDPNA
jgi:hypothetical protein